MLIVLTSRAVLSRLIAVLLTAALVAAACGDDDDAATPPDPTPATADDGADADDETADDDGAAEDGADPTPDPTAAPSPTPAPEVDNTDLTVKPVVQVSGEAPPDELVVEDIVEGSGPAAEAGDVAIMQYVGVLHDTGEQFDASWDRGAPFTFTLGQGDVIAGWDQGIEGMATGGRRELVIPPELAYGETGSGSGSIGPDETLVFVVDLVGLIPADLTKPDVTVPDEGATELQVTDVVEGTGAEATAGTALLLHYVGKLQSTGEQFDATWDRGAETAVPVALGIGQLIEGLEQGLEGMKVGGRREIVIPPDLAFGEAGAGDGRIPPDETLVFVVDLIAVNG